MNCGLDDVDGSILAVSQFTLYGDAKKRTAPSFIEAARPEHAEPLLIILSPLCAILVWMWRPGVGAVMDVEIHNDGPVTLILERE